MSDITRPPITTFIPILVERGSLSREYLRFVDGTDESQESDPYAQYRQIFAERDARLAARAADADGMHIAAE